MNLPTTRIYRAMIRKGMITEAQVPVIQAHFDKNPKAQQELARVWRQGRGARWTRLADLANWLWERREIIMQIFSIALLFADEAPSEKQTSFSTREKSKKLEKELDEEVQRNQDAGFYDIGAWDSGVFKEVPPPATEIDKDGETVE